MNWDDFKSEANDEAAFTGNGNEQMCPEGTHVGTIGWTTMQPKAWAVNAAANPSGMCLTVRIDIRKGIKAVFDSIPCHRRGAIEALCRSARVDPPRGDWDETSLKGQAVTFESVIALSKKGNDYVIVKGYKPNADPLPAAIRDRPLRTPTQKADAASSSDTNDDIPF